MRLGIRIAVVCAVVLAAESALLLSRIAPAGERPASAEPRLDTLAGRISTYARNTGGLPHNMDSLMCTRQFSDAGSEGYLVDTWGTPIRYEVTGTGSFRLTSFGADKEPGGADVFSDRTREYMVEDALDSQRSSMDENPAPHDAW